MADDDVLKIDETIPEEIGPKEKVYDEQIAPLMRQIQALCREHGINQLSLFQLDEDRQCTTFYTTEEDSPGKQQVKQLYTAIAQDTVEQTFLTPRRHQQSRPRRYRRS